MWGIAAAVVANFTLLFMLINFLNIGKKLDIQNAHDAFVYYAGKKLGTVFECIAFTYLIVQVVVFFTGAGAYFAEALGTSTLVGAGVMGGLIIITVLFGLNKIVDIMGSLGWILIICIISMCAIFLFKHAPNLVS